MYTFLKARTQVRRTRSIGTHLEGYDDHNFVGDFKNGSFVKIRTAGEIIAFPNSKINFSDMCVLQM